MPVPALARLPLVVAMTPPMVVLPEPVTVRATAVPVIPVVPLPMVRVPASEARVAPRRPG